jgi:hypothetical protein
MGSYQMRCSYTVSDIFEIGAEQVWLAVKR